MAVFFRNKLGHALMIALLCFSACSPSATLSQEEVRSNPPGTLKAYLTDGRLITFSRYAVVGNSLAGFGEIDSRIGRRPFQGSIRMDSIQRLEGGNTNNTSLIVLAAVGVAGIVYYLYTNSTVMYDTGIGVVR